MSTPSDYTDRHLGGCLFESTPQSAPELLSRESGLPERVDLRPLCSPVEDQGHIGSCAANAVVGAMEYLQRRRGEGVTDLSRLFVYYNARQLAGHENEDSGTFIHHAMAAVLAHGACPESMWPYQPALWASRPTDACYQAATEFEGLSFARTPLGPACKTALAMGLPVVFGATLPAESLQVEAAATGRISIPDGPWPPPGGGHAMLIVGYDDAQASWILRNSWGTKWGDEGYAQVPYQVLERYASPTQFWVIGEIEASSLRGPSMGETLQSLRAGAQRAADDALAKLRRGLRSKLEGDLDRARRGFRERLRGPGAGGGYDS